MLGKIFKPAGISPISGTTFFIITPIIMFRENIFHRREYDK